MRELTSYESRDVRDVRYRDQCDRRHPATLPFAQPFTRRISIEGILQSTVSSLNDFRRWRLHKCRIYATRS